MQSCGMRTLGIAIYIRGHPRGWDGKNLFKQLGKQHAWQAEKYPGIVAALLAAARGSGVGGSGSVGGSKYPFYHQISLYSKDKGTVPARCLLVEPAR